MSTCPFYLPLLVSLTFGHARSNLGHSSFPHLPVHPPPLFSCHQQFFVTFLQAILHSPWQPFLGKSLAKWKKTCSKHVVATTGPAKSKIMRRLPRSPGNRGIKSSLIPHLSKLHGSYFPSSHSRTGGKGVGMNGEATIALERAPPSPPCLLMINIKV